ETLKFPNASTPGEAADAGGVCEPGRGKDDWQRPSDVPPSRPRPSWPSTPPPRDVTPPPRVATPAPRRDVTPPPPRVEEPRRDATPPPSTRPAADVPWGAILGGAAVIGAMVHQNRRDRRDSRDSRPHPPPSGHTPSPADP